jgi:hypothetical protein
MNFYTFDTSFNLTEFRWSGQNTYLVKTIGSAFTNAVDVGFNGRDFAILEDTNSTTYTLRTIRTNGVEINNTAVSPTNFRNPHSVDWDGRNWLVYFSTRTGTAPNTREFLKIAFHRRDSSHIFSTNGVQFGVLTGANGRKGCWAGKDHAFIYNTGATSPSGAVVALGMFREQRGNLIQLTARNLDSGYVYRGLDWDGSKLICIGNASLATTPDFSIHRNYYNSNTRIDISTFGAVYNGLCTNQRRAA